MMSRLQSLCILLAVAAVASRARGQFDDLVRRVPDSANALVVADVAKILDSPQAKRENWVASHAELFAGGLTSIPPNTRRMIVASQLDFQFMESFWEVALLEMTATTPLSVVARQQRGRLDTLDGVPAVSLPNDAYLAQLGDNLVGAIAPGDRQNAARWVRRGEASSRSSLSPYLQKAYEYVAAVRSADAVVALDLRDVVAAADVRRRIEDSELLFLQIPAAKADELSQVLASIQGVMLGATFGDTTRGKLRVDFGRDASVMKEFAQPLLLKLLEDHGVMIDDFRQWTGKVEGAQFSIEGELSTAGRRRVMSLIDLPASPMMSRAKPAKEERTARVDPKAYSTQRYFQLVDGYLDDLQAARKEARTIAAIGVWLDKYPRKIDRMPMLGVDSEMLDYGRFVSQQLRSASMAIKGIGIASRVRGAEATYGGYRYGRYGWYGDSAYWTAGLADQQSAVTLVRVQERTRGAASALQILAQLEPARRDIREKMMKKYQLEF